MSTVTVRDMRNNSASVLARVGQGESLTVTRDGDPVAEIVPLPRRPLSAELLVRRFANLPRVDAADLRRDIDTVMDATL